MLHLDRAKAPTIERSEMTQYCNMGSSLIDSIPGLWRSRDVTFIYARLLCVILLVILA